MASATLPGTMSVIDNRDQSYSARMKRMYPTKDWPMRYRQAVHSWR